MVSEESHERHFLPGIGDTDSVVSDSSQYPPLIRSFAMDGKGHDMDRSVSHSFKCRQTFADYLCTKPARKPRERRVFTMEGGTIRINTYQRVGTVQDASTLPEKTNETPQREKIVKPARGEDDAGHQQGVHAVGTLLDLQLKQLSKLAVCHNRAVDTEGRQRRDCERAWGDLLQPTEAILLEVQQE